MFNGSLTIIQLLSCNECKKKAKTICQIVIKHAHFNRHVLDNQAFKSECQ